jgi:hypothetical protein
MPGCGADHLELARRIASGRLATRGPQGLPHPLGDSQTARAVCSISRSSASSRIT